MKRRPKWSEVPADLRRMVIEKLGSYAEAHSGQDHVKRLASEKNQSTTPADEQEMLQRRIHACVAAATHLRWALRQEKLRERVARKRIETKEKNDGRV